MAPITPALLHALALGGDPAIMAALAPELDAQLVPAGIGNALRVAHFLAQAAVETWAFTQLAENLSYGPLRIPEVWPRLKDRADALANNPHALGNAAYANINGNGDEASGDGWLYRGRGLFDLTGRANYESVGRLCGQDFVSAPDLVSQPHWAVASAVAFWTARHINEAADADDIARVTRLINGGREGLSDRAILKRRALALLSA